MTMIVLTLLICAASFVFAYSVTRMDERLRIVERYTMSHHKNWDNQVAINKSVETIIKKPAKTDQPPTVLQ